MTLKEKKIGNKYRSEQSFIWHIQSSKKELEDLQKLWAEHFEKN